MKYTLSSIIAVSLLTSGCSALNPGNSSGSFDCPGMPKGVVCKNPREVYEMTNGSNSSISESSLKQTLPNSRIVVSKSSSNSSGPAYAEGEPGIQPEPLVTQTKVLRIWVAPWVDKAKELHWPGLMFVQIQKSDWNYGENNFENVEPPVPHLITSTIIAPDRSHPTKN